MSEAAEGGVITRPELSREVRVNESVRSSGPVVLSRDGIITLIAPEKDNRISYFSFNRALTPINSWATPGSNRVLVVERIGQAATAEVALGSDGGMTLRKTPSSHELRLQNVKVVSGAMPTHLGNGEWAFIPATEVGDRKGIEVSLAGQVYSLRSETDASKQKNFYLVDRLERRYPLPRYQVVRVGRGTSSVPTEKRISLDAKDTVSRNHLVVVVSPNGIFLEDTSSNGTQVSTVKYV